MVRSSPEVGTACASAPRDPEPRDTSSRPSPERDRRLVNTRAADATGQSPGDAAEAAQHDDLALRGDFLAVACHELSTPLTALKLEVANLLRLARQSDTAADPRLVAKGQRIDAQAQRLGELIDELLEVSRISGGHLDFLSEAVDLGAVTAETCARLTASLGQSTCTVTVESPQAVIGLWDRRCLDRMVTNLVANAIRFGDGKPITVTVRAEGDRARLTVCDCGLGIVPEDRDRAFGRFERAATQPAASGGLGLWSVRQIAEALGGSLSVEHLPGGAGALTVDLPRREPVQRAARKASAQQPAMTARATAPSSTCTVIRGALTPPSAAPAPIAAPEASPKRWA